MGEDESRAILRIEIDTVRPLLGSDVGEIIRNSATAFELDRDHTVVPPLELRLVGVYAGSLVLDLMAIGVAAALSFEEVRDAVRRFVRGLGEAATRILRDGTSESLHIDALVKSASLPIVGGDARSFKMSERTNNEDAFVLGEEMAAAIVERMRRRDEEIAVLHGRAAAQATLRWEKNGWVAQIGRHDFWVENPKRFSLDVTMTYVANGVVRNHAELPDGFEINDLVPSDGRTENRGQ